MELTNLANMSGSNVNFDSLGKVLSITEKLHDTTSASIYEIISKIWEKYDCDLNGTISIEEAKLFV